MRTSSISSSVNPIDFLCVAQRRTTGGAAPSVRGGSVCQRGHSYDTPLFKLGKETDRDAVGSRQNADRPGKSTQIIYRPCHCSPRRSLLQSHHAVTVACASGCGSHAGFRGTAHFAFAGTRTFATWRRLLTVSMSKQWVNGFGAVRDARSSSRAVSGVLQRVCVQRVCAVVLIQRQQEMQWWSRQQRQPAATVAGWHRALVGLCVDIMYVYICRLFELATLEPRLWHRPQRGCTRWLPRR